MIIKVFLRGFESHMIPQVMQFLSGVIFLDTNKNRNVLRQVMPWTVLRVRFEAERRQVQFLLGAPSFVRVLARESHAV
jgi:hypothetical protein